MALVPMEYDQTISRKLTATVPQNRFSTAVVNAYLYEKIVVVSFYFACSINLAKNDVLASFDIPSDFTDNFFANEKNGKIVNLRASTKNLVIDQTAASGDIIYGQVVGILL